MVTAAPRLRVLKLRSFGLSPLWGSPNWRRELGPPLWGSLNEAVPSPRALPEADRELPRWGEYKNSATSKSARRARLT